MKRSIRRLPDSELELMQIIWQKEPPVSRTEIEENLKTRKAVKVIVDSAVAVAPKAEEKAE